MHTSAVDTTSPSDVGSQRPERVDSRGFHSGDHVQTKNKVVYVKKIFSPKERFQIVNLPTHDHNAC